MSEQPMTDEQMLTEIQACARRIERDRARMLELIPQVFPENRGEEPVRGRLTAVVKATGWTRDYVARIRDGKGPKKPEPQ